MKKKVHSLIDRLSPEKSLAILVVLIFVNELGLMFAFHFTPFSIGPAVESLLDASLLTLLMLPAVWLLVMRPLRQAAQSEKARAESVIRHSSNGIISIDQEMMIQAINPTAAKIFDYTEKELVGMQRLEVLAPELTTLRFEKNIFYQTIGKKKNGSELYLEISMSPINHNGEDFHVSYLRDVTKEKLLEQARIVQLNIANLLTEADLDNSDDKSVKQKLLQIICNGMDWQLGELWKADPEQDLLNHSCQWSDPSIDAKQFYNDASNLVFKRTDVKGLPCAIWNNKTPIWINDATTDPLFIRKTGAAQAGLHSAFGMPIVAQQEVIGVVVFYSARIWDRNEAFLSVMADVENSLNLFFERWRFRKLLKKQQMEIIEKSKLSALGEMSAGIAHEINNPLAIISLLAEKLSLSVDSGLDHNLIKVTTKQILTATTRAAKIIKGLRTFSRDGSHDPFSTVLLKSIIDETLVLCEQKLKINEVGLHVSEIPTQLQIECNSAQISQVVLNLMNNAFDAVATLSEKWIKLDFRDGESTVEIIVTDSGPGISKEVRDRLFQPFFTTKEVGMGTGLGLSISKGIIASHKGTLSIDSTSPNTCFVITLPKQQKHSSLRAS